MKNIYLLLLFFVTLPLSAQSRYNLQLPELLVQLDQMIDQKTNYQQIREEKAQVLKKAAASTQGMRRVSLLQQIYDTYSHFQTDSAQVALNEIAHMPEMQHDAALSGWWHIAQSELLAISGFYTEALKEMKAVKPDMLAAGGEDLRLQYLRIQRTIYGWMANYANAGVSHQRLLKLTQNYRDSILMIEKPGISRTIVEADKLLINGQAQKAIDLLRPYVGKRAGDSAPYVYSVMAQAYHEMKNSDEAMRFLALAALSDLERGVTEYQALPLLAQELYQHNDVQRAYNYLICSMEDANFCKARLRAVEVSNIFPIINKVYKEREHAERHRERLFVYALTILALALLSSMIYLYRQLKKVRSMRRQQMEMNKQLKVGYEQLSTVNEQLKRTYDELQLSDKMKEEYLTRYLNRCRDYLDRIDNDRRSAYRMLKDHQTDELMKHLKSDARTKAEQEHFFEDFDAAFLAIFPDFIRSFNALLRPGEEIQPKAENRLTTELRIFALIRLGVTDTAHIAHFMNNSTATIYNYRSKVRNHSKGNPDEFESKVSKI